MPLPDFDQLYRQADARPVRRGVCGAWGHGAWGQTPLAHWLTCI